jgi:5-methylthioadenosine/S-adenosylhomocysteine deaminase
MSDILIENGRMMIPGSAGTSVYSTSEHRWSQPGYLAISDGKITALGTGPVPARLRDTVRLNGHEISATDMAVMPGLTNAHTHLSQTFMRGLSGGRPLLRWLKELIWPLQAAMTLEELELAALLGMVENLRCGATQLVDHQKITKTPAFSEAVCTAALKTGLRLTLARAWSDKGTNAESAQSILDELTGLFERYDKASLAGGYAPQVRIASGPLTPWRATAETLQKTHALAKRWGSSTHIHVSETRDEVNMTVDETGLRPVAWLDQLGILDPECQVVHATWLEDQEIDLLRDRGALVVHCPVSNAVLGSGMARVDDMRRAGIRIHLGTDGPASNDNQDCFDNMKATLIVAHLRENDPTQLSPVDVVQMATAGKSLAVGDDADVILVNLRNANAVPVHDIDSALALCCHGSDVDTVIVAGRVLMRGKRVLTIDEEALLQECQQAVIGLRKRAGLD